MIFKQGDVFDPNLRTVSSRCWRLNITKDRIDYWEGNSVNPFEIGSNLNLNMLENEKGNPGIQVIVLYKMDATKVDPDDWSKYQDVFIGVHKVIFDNESISFRDRTGKQHVRFFDHIDSIIFTQEV